MCLYSHYAGYRRAYQNMNDMVEIVAWLVIGLILCLVGLGSNGRK